jgi:hypothetical protein
MDLDKHRGRERHKLAVHGDDGNQRTGSMNV